MKLSTLALTFLGAAASATAAVIGNEFISFTSDERGVPMAHVSVSVAKVFPAAAIDLSGFDLDVGYTNYNTTLFQKIATDLADAKGTLESKAGAVVSALYGKEFASGADADMDDDYHRLTTATNPTALQTRNNPYLSWATNHAIKLSTCAAFLSCISGTTCGFYVTINQAPRSRCESQGGQNCCLSWANYNVKAGFFQATWTSCYSAHSGDTGSCEGHDNNSGNGGDVCYSNRADGCT